METVDGHWKGVPPTVCSWFCIIVLTPLEVFGELFGRGYLILSPVIIIIIVINTIDIESNDLNLKRVCQADKLAAIFRTSISYYDIQLLYHIHSVVIQILSTYIRLEGDH